MRYFICLSKKVYSLVLFSVFFVTPAYFTAPVSAMEINAVQQFQYAEHLYKNKAYTEAITEWKRFLFFFPDDKRCDDASFHIALSYFYQKKYAQSIEAFNTLITLYPKTPFRFDALFKISESYVQLNSHMNALGTLKQVYLNASDEAHKDKASYKAAWIHIEIGDFAGAMPFFDTISFQNQERYQTESLKEALNDKKSIQRKSPGFAGFLAIVPGAGHLYTGRYHDAFTSLLINGGLSYAAYEAFVNEQYGLGGLLSFFEMGFYTANFYSAINSAHKYNRRKKREYIDTLKENFSVRLLSTHGNNGIVALFHYDL